MAAITDIAQAFFDACETGKGWEACKAHCKPDATFAAQAEPLADVRTLQQYADWMKGIMTVMPDGSYLACRMGHERTRLGLIWARAAHRRNV